MKRTQLWMIVFGFVSLLHPLPIRAQDDTLRIGEVYEGEVTEKKYYSALNLNQFSIELQISLKAYQSISFTSTVPGVNTRTVVVALQDPSGQIIAHQRGTKVVRLTVPEVSATGKYTVIVISDQVGAFKLKAIGSSSEELTIKLLEEKIKSLKQELAEAEAKLKSLKAGKK